MRGFSLGIPILAVALGMGVMFSLPLLAASWAIREPAATCTPVLSTNIKKADRILIGRVEAVLPSTPYLDVWIEPVTWYKGKSADAYVRLLARDVPTTASAGSATDLHFASGQAPYLFFLRSVTGGKYRTSRCWGTRALGSGLTSQERAVLTEI